MHIEKYIRKIVEDGDIKEMEKLSDMLEETIEIIKDYDENTYKKFKMRLYKMAYVDVLTEEIAEDIVSNMKPYHMYFSPSEAREIQQKYAIDDIRPTDFFITLNMAYNDYKSVFGDNLEMYVKFAEAFIQDEDAKEDKVFLYFMTIPK